MERQQENDIDAKKKIRATTRKNNGAIFMLRCAERGLTSQDLDDMTIGMVLDMLIEKGNDKEKYPFEGTSEDVKDFFG